MGLVDSVIHCLSDGQWHDINELSTHQPLRKTPIYALLINLDFLAEYDFIELSEDLKGDPPRRVVKARLTTTVQEFLRKIRWVERSEHAG